MEAQAWTAIGLLAATLMGAFFYLGNRIDGLGSEMRSQFQGHGSRADTMSARIDSLGNRIDSLGNRIDEQGIRLADRIYELGVKLDDHIRWHAS